MSQSKSWNRRWTNDSTKRTHCPTDWRYYYVPIHHRRRRRWVWMCMSGLVRIPWKFPVWWVTEVTCCTEWAAFCVSSVVRCCVWCAVVGFCRVGSSDWLFCLRSIYIHSKVFLRNVGRFLFPWQQHVVLVMILICSVTFHCRVHNFQWCCKGTDVHLKCFIFIPTFFFSNRTFIIFAWTNMSCFLCAVLYMVR